MSGRELRVLIQNEQTRAFFAGPNSWHVDPDLAFNFQDGVQALRFVKDNHLAGVQILLKFRDGRYNRKMRLK